MKFCFLSKNSYVNKGTQFSTQEFSSVLLSIKRFFYSLSVHTSLRKGRSPFTVFLCWYNPSVFSTIVNKIIWIGQVKKPVSKLLFTAVFSPCLLPHSDSRRWKPLEENVPSAKIFLKDSKMKNLLHTFLQSNKNHYLCNELNQLTQ